MWIYNNYTYSPELYHHGIKGMRWGVRRYQNEDGSLTAAGKKRVSKQYKKELIKGDKAFKRAYNKMYVDSYNKTADKMNNGGIEKFNAAQKKKYGNKYADREGYNKDYFDMFNKEMEKTLNEAKYDFRLHNANYKKADNLVKKYSMEKFDDLARKNEAGIEAIRKSIGLKSKSEIHRERVDLFKKHPDLYDDFGGPDKIDDDELFELVLLEKGYSK